MWCTFPPYFVVFTFILVIVHIQNGSSHVIPELENSRDILNLRTIRFEGLNAAGKPFQSLGVPNLGKVGRVRRWAIPADIQDSLCPPGYIRRSDRITCHRSEIEDDYDTSEPKKII